MTGSPRDTPELVAALAHAAMAMPAGHLEALARSLLHAPAPDPDVRAQALAAVPTPTYRQQAAAVLDAWSSVAPNLTGYGIVLALSAALAATALTRAEQQVEVVWTGPATTDVPVRRTQAVLLEIIDGARSRLTVVSFAAYKVDEVVHSLGVAAGRGVEIRLVLETTADSGGRLTHDAAPAFAALGDAVAVYAWPGDQRAGPDGLAGAMHAKAAIADGQVAFVTSANLTGSAMAANMELGLVVRGGEVPRQLERHVDDLIARGVLRRCGT